VAVSRLSWEDRVRIEVGWRQGLSFAELGTLTGRPASTVYREVARNHSGRHGTKNPRAGSLPAGRRGLYRWGYVASWAHGRARGRLARPKPARLKQPGLLRTVVLASLRLRWSPEQVSRRLRRDFPERPEMWVSHETIYQAIYLQSRGHLRAELTRQVALRSGRARRSPQRQTVGAVRSRRPWAANWHISSRPAEVADRAVPGHWEGDLLMGAKPSGSAIITLVERSTRFVMLGRLPAGQASDEVVPVLTELMRRVPHTLRRSLTWDLGAEMADNASFRLEANCPIYFCDPHSPWQRGSNENTNGLLRQYFPKGTSLRPYSQADLDAVAEELNGRPRKTLGWDTPSEALTKYLDAMTG
jgi:transposase, IS30 family